MWDKEGAEDRYPKSVVLLWPQMSQGRYPQAGGRDRESQGSKYSGSSKQGNGKALPGDQQEKLNREAELGQGAGAKEGTAGSGGGSVGAAGTVGGTCSGALRLCL